MTGIQSSIGLISGIDYTSLVDQLIQIDSIPVTNLASRTELLTAEEAALTSLLSKFLLSSYMIGALNSLAPFQRCDVSSSNPAVLAAVKNTTSGTPVQGTHTFTPIQLAAAQQTIAQGVVSSTDALGKTGTITVGKGWSLDNAVELKDLNGGSGVSKGSIRITDGSGTRATIDLRKAVTMQDVVDAINSTDSIDVYAELVEDHLVLTDSSGGDVSKFLVQEVSGGSTAASLGIANLCADDEGVAVGTSLYRLGENMPLSMLNDGNGVVFDDIWADIVVQCRDGSTVNIDFFKRSTTAEIAAGAPELYKETTVGDLIKTINDSLDTGGVGGKVHAKISDDGKSLVIEDTTQGTSFTTLSQVSTNPVFKTLGLISGDYTGSPVHLFSGLARNGPAELQISDKAGNTAVISFTQTELDTIASGGMSAAVSALNSKIAASGVNIKVQLNNDYTGFDIVDQSGGTGGTLWIGDNNGTGLAAKLGLTNYAAADAVAALAGVDPGAMRFTDRFGASAVIDISQTELDDLTDVNSIVDLFNAKLTATGIGVACEANDTGDGVKFVDTTGLTDILSALAGVEPGQIEFTDRTGYSAVIDISQEELDALTSISDLRDLFNNKLSDRGLFINCQLDTSGGGIKFTDTSGYNTSNLKIEQVGTVINPADSLTERLGIAADVAADEIAGQTGYAVSNLKIEWNGASSGTGEIINSITYRLGISANVNGDEVNGYAFDSMLHGEAVNPGALETRHLIGNLDSVLMSTLNGGNGLSKATAGTIEVQDRAGNTAELNFTQAELDSIQTLNDAVQMLNTKLSDAGIGITVKISESNTGLQLVDTTGSFSHNLKFNDKEVTVTNGDGTTATHNPKIAASFGFGTSGSVDAASSAVNGSSLQRQIVSYDTKLSDLNNGKGVTLTGGRILITDSAGNTATLVIDAAKHQTVGDIIKAINTSSSSLKVTAKINDTGDGIMLEEFAGGAGSFSVIDADSVSKFASELKIAGSVAQADKGEDGRMRIDARQSYTVDVEATDSLDTIRQKLNALNAGFSATIVQDGSSNPYRLAISGKTTGAAGAFSIDLSVLGLTTENMSEAQDALLVYGDINSNAGLVLHSSTNAFKGIIDGIDLTVTGISTSPVTVTSADSSVDVKAALDAFVTNYNAFRTELNTVTYYSVAENAGNILYNSPVARAFDKAVSDALLKRVYGIAGITSLADIGITIRSNVDDESINASTNTLTFDTAKFDALWETNKEGIQAFFFQERTTLDADGAETTIKTGWAQSFADSVDSIINSDHGKVASRLEVLSIQIDANAERTDFLNARLEVKRQMMLNKFYAMEQAMAKMSTAMTTVSGIASAWSANTVS
ncbi:MAG: flagellar filament capping protein FliD [Planctomycetaceae bacterium]|jgi:flagellar hook-associated protein 2|nr:flagellar filament capping protein FliD [Planctomycetaceae bacterium]